MSHRLQLVDGPTAIRPTEPGDAVEQLRLRVANRAHTEPWDPERTESFYTASGQQLELDLDRRAWTAGTAYAFAILATGSAPRIIGRIALANVARGPWQNATLGYWVDEASCRRGHATRAVRLILRFAFDELGLHRVQPAILPRNAASIGVAEKVGFRREGLARGYLRIAGRWEDHIIYALTREEWEAMPRTMDG